MNVDKRIDTSDFKGDIAGISQLIQFDDLMLQPIAEKLKEDFFTDYTKVLPFKIIPEEDVINSNEYKAVNDGLRSFLGAFMSIPKGYKYIPATEKDAQNILKSLGADAVISITAIYKLEKTISIGGFGIARVRATLYVTCTDKDGKSLMDSYSVAYSNKDLKFALDGLFNAKQILPLCEEATENVSAELFAWFEEEISKRK